MRIGPAEGSAVQLEVLGYQYPARASDTAELDWDANWLLIKGSVTSDEHPGWSFTDACLTTSEARSLGDWLRSVALGEIRPGPVDLGQWEDGGLLWFTEPALGFSLADRSAETLAIRVHLSFEALPPGMSGQRPEMYEHVVVVRTTSAELALTVDDWFRELSAFPVR